MFDTHAVGNSFAVVAMLAAAGWVLSLFRRDASVVDPLWSLFFLSAVVTYRQLHPTYARGDLVLWLVTLWALRLAGYLAWRNWGEPEDRRYRRIRERNEPGFWWKSLYLVFGLQALLAAVLSLPLLWASGSRGELGWLDALGTLLWLAGFIFESVADLQLAHFLGARRGAAVLDRGLWRYTRHPNYFGEALLWWGYFLLAAAAGGWWTVVAPLLMTFLLLRVSGVSLLEADIAERRPEYRLYRARTSPFLPWPPRRDPA